MISKAIDHSPHALAALGLVAAGTLGICASVSAFGGKFIPPAICAGLSGVAIACGYGLHRKFDLTGSDYKGAGNLAIDGLDSAFAEYVAPAVKKLIEVEELPPALKSVGQTLIDSMADLSWVDQFFTKSFVVVGRTNDGKTVFNHFAISRYIEKNPKGTIRIWDGDYGKRGGAWFGLPVANKNRTGHEIVFYEETDFVDLLEEAYSIFKKRQAHTRENPTEFTYKPHLLMMAEAATELENLKDHPRGKELSKKVRELLKRGHGYKVFLGLETQSAELKTLSLEGRGDRKQLNMIVLGASATDADEVKTLMGDTSALIERVKTIRKTPGGKYAAIANIDGLGVGVHIVPHIDLSTIEILVPESAKPESERWCDGLEWGVIEKSQAGITKLWEQFGDGKQLDSNPKYLSFKRRFEQLKNQDTA